jgi:hypothetical protein
MGMLDVLEEPESRSYIRQVFQAKSINPAKTIEQQEQQKQKQN